jgi:hypothetical protein
MENLVEWRLAAETEVLGENLPLPPRCPPEIPLDQTRARIRAAEVGSQRLTAWAMARPSVHALDREATMMDILYSNTSKLQA